MRGAVVSITSGVRGALINLGTLLKIRMRLMMEKLVVVH
jgi:hypothetical protein